MLNVSSGRLDGVDLQDLAADARIRQVAMRQFAAEGFARTTVRAIAAEAGVSPALVIHHFSSKDGLREACDARVRALFDQAQQLARAGGPPGAVGSIMAMSEEAMAMAGYLARLSAEGLPGATELFAELISRTEVAMEQMVADGVARPSADPAMRAAVLFCLRAGALLLADAVQVSTGADVRTEPGLMRMVRATLELLTEGALSDRTALEAFDASQPVEAVVIGRAATPVAPVPAAPVSAAPVPAAPTPTPLEDPRSDPPPAAAP
jgi:AcrR family transcriptional regulator